MQLRNSLRELLQSHANPERALHAQRFFKTAPGQYGHGDIFLGIPVPLLRTCAKQHVHLSLTELTSYINSPLHEERLAALFILIEQYKKKKTAAERSEIYTFYITHMYGVNNWDLVDTSAPSIIGAYLFDKDHTQLLLWAQDAHLWKRRIAIIATLYFIRKNRFETTFTLATLLLQDTEDLMHKAVGWMLREVEKKAQSTQDAAGLAAYHTFMRQHHATMPRTMLRYAIERLPETQRLAYLHGTIK